MTLDDAVAGGAPGTATITAHIDNAVTGSDLHLNLSNGTTITIAVGATSGTSAAFAATADATIGVNSVSGGNFEALVTSDTALMAVNDAPVNALPGAQTVAEDTNLAITGLSISDTDAGSASNITTTLSVAHGTLTVSSAGGAAVSGSGTGSVTLTGSIAQINTTLAAINNVVYKGVLDFNGSDTLTITTNDHGNTGIDPGLTGTASSEQDSDSLAITVTAVNDAPVATITPVSYANTEQMALNLKNNGLSISDVDAGSGSMSVTLAVTEGTLTVTAGTSGAVGHQLRYLVGHDHRHGGAGQRAAEHERAPARQLRRQHRYAERHLDADPDGARQRQHRHRRRPRLGRDLHHQHHGRERRSGGDDHAGELRRHRADEPHAQEHRPVDQRRGCRLRLHERDAGRHRGHADGDRRAPAARRSPTPARSSVTITGTVAQVNALLNTNATSTVSYVDNTDTPSASSTLTLTVHDNGNTGTGGDLVSVATSTINITAVNDAPVATITPVSYAATEQTSLTLKGTGLSISDVDAGSGSMSVTLAVTEGTLTVTAGTSGATVSDSGTSSVTITGTVAQINDLLNTNATSTVSYVDNTDTPSATSTLTLTVHDNGNTGTGGDLVSVATSTINITAVNDAPVATITPVSYANTEQVSAQPQEQRAVDHRTSMPAPAP